MTNIEPATRRPPARADRLIAGIGAVRRWLLRLIVCAGVAAAFLTYAILRGGFPGGGKGVLAVVGIAAAVAPPLVLGAFWLALAELGRLPERLQRLPLDARGHAEELRVIYDRARAARGSRFHLARVLWQLSRTTAAARDTFAPYGPLLPFLSVPFLVSTATAFVAAWLELIVACVVALVLLAG